MSREYQIDGISPAHQRNVSPISNPILERFGFVNIAMATACVWQPEKKEMASSAI